MRLDFPTFDLPIKAYSGFVSLGHIDTIGALRVNSAFFISIYFYFGRKGTKKILKNLEVTKILRTFATFFNGVFHIEKHIYLKFKHFKRHSSTIIVCIQKKN